MYIQVVVQLGNDRSDRQGTEKRKQTEKKRKETKRTKNKVQKQAAFKSFTILFKLDFLVSMKFRENYLIELI